VREARAVTTYRVIVPTQPPAPRPIALPGPTIARLEVHIYQVPTATPEADGTIAWDSTSVVLVEATASSGQIGVGFSYASRAAAEVIHRMLFPIASGRPVDAVRAIWGDMIKAVRNAGQPGIAATAISAVDIALWDLKGRVAQLPLFRLLGAHREGVPIYGSGGFTTYSEEQLCRQLSGWVEAGIPRVKMKIGKDWGTEPDVDIRRVESARKAIGPDAELYVDANGGYTVKEATAVAGQVANLGVTWFEEPVSSDQLSQLAFVREHIPMRVAAGEYGYSPWYFREMLGAEAVDVIQADATRCLGVDGFFEAAALAHAFGVPFSAHTAPAIHAHLGCIVPAILNVEYFSDHLRVEDLFFDGLPRRVGGYLYPDPDRPGFGWELKRPDADKYRVA